MSKHTSMREIYYISFVLMVVAPVLLVVLISFSVFRFLTPAPALSPIESRHDTVILFVTTEMSDKLAGNTQELNLENAMLPNKQEPVIFRTGHGQALENFLAEQKNGQTGWKLVSCMKISELTKEWYRITGTALFLAASALCLLYVLFSQIFLKKVLQPMHTVTEGLLQIEKGNLATYIPPAGIHEIRLMIRSFNWMVHQLNASVREQESARETNTKAQLQALQAQINPHFLMNTLNSIRFMAQISRFEGIRRMAEALIQILTCSFRAGSGFYTVREELAVLDSYIYLMKIRYSNGFEYVCEADEDCMELMMPRLILQPLAENSIVHGFSEMEEEMGDETGQLVLRVWQEDRQLVLELEDNGNGMTREEIAEVLSDRDRPIRDRYLRERHAGEGHIRERHTVERRIQEQPAGERRIKKQHVGDWRVTEQHAEEGHTREQCANAPCSIGLSNVFRRLKLNFNHTCNMEIDSKQGCYTRTRIRIPVIQRTRRNEELDESGCDC